MSFGLKLFEFACNKVKRSQSKQRKKSLSRIRGKSDLNTEGDMIMNINKEISIGYSKLGNNAMNQQIESL